MNEETKSGPAVSKPKKYRVKGNFLNSGGFGPGDIVYALMGYDYGCAADDTRNYGVEHISVTLSPDGSYPGSTVPLADLEEIKE